MNRYLRNVLTISATTLMMLGVSGVASHARTHACTTAFNEVSSSPDMVASYVQKAESYDNGNGSYDAEYFLDNNGSQKLFNNYYLNPCDEQQYKVATVGHLADDMNGMYWVVTADNKNNIAHSLDQKEMTIYNDELSHDGAQLNTHINGSSYSDNVPLTTNPSKLTIIKNINKQINNAENNDDGNGSYDAEDFLDNNSGNVVLFNHFYSDPNSENEYKLATVGHLADDMNNMYGVITSANKNNIKQSLTPEQLTLYNIRLGEDGAPLSAYVSQSPYQFADSDNTSETTHLIVPPKKPSNNKPNNNKSNKPNKPSNPKKTVKPNITVIKPAKRKARIIVKPRKRVAKHVTRRHRAVRRHVARRAVRRARYGHSVHGHYVKYQFGYFNKNGRWVKYRSGHYTKRGKWIRNHKATKRNKRSRRNKRHVSKRRSRRMRKQRKHARHRVRRY